MQAERGVSGHRGHKDHMTELHSIEDLRPDAKNANRGTERGLAILEDSLRKYGAGRSILVDKDGEVIAGNKTLEVAAALDLPVRVVKTNGTELVVVQREDLDLDDGDKARELAYADNRSSQVGLDWDLERILADANEGVDLSGLWGEKELDDLLAKADKQSGEQAECPISPELFERHDYLVIYFDNEFDWQVACQTLGVEQAQSAKVDKKTLDNRGLGRVIPGAKFLKMIGHE